MKNEITLRPPRQRQNKNFESKKARSGHSPGCSTDLIEPLLTDLKALMQASKLQKVRLCGSPSQSKPAAVQNSVLSTLQTLRDEVDQAKAAIDKNPNQNATFQSVIVEWIRELSALSENLKETHPRLHAPVAAFLHSTRG